ncbi:hypothetical protein T492DRAFT_1110005 [Pavlovales sp. CCMP2436]|nr:hypothetical protein T492DRAFT_1110005 [Pavlovales sp. CCMP2436]
MILQTFKSIPISNRKTISHLILFKPNNRSEGESVTEELVMMPNAHWDSYVTHAFGEGKPHSFLFLDVDKQAVFDRDFCRLEAEDVASDSDTTVKLETKASAKDDSPRRKRKKV